MTTIADPRPTITGGVDTHLDVHVAAVVTAVGGVLGTAEFPTTAAGYRRLVGWMRSFGELDQVGVEGTGTYGVSLARHLRTEQVTVVEVMRPNRQVRRRHGKTDVVDASPPRGLCSPGKPTPSRRPTMALWRPCGL
jgi:transposase